MKLFKKIYDFTKSFKWDYTRGSIDFNADFFTVQHGLFKKNVKWAEIELIETTLYDGLLGVLIIYRKGKREVYVDEQMTNWMPFLEFIEQKLENFDRSKCERFWDKMQDGKVVCWKSF